MGYGNAENPIGVEKGKNACARGRSALHKGRLCLVAWQVVAVHSFVIIFDGDVEELASNVEILGGCWTCSRAT